MTTNVTLLNASGKLSRYSDLLKDEIESPLTRVGEFFELSAIDITVSPFQKGEESPSGLGGYALSEHRVELLVDCSRDDIDKVIKSELLEILEKRWVSKFLFLAQPRYIQHPFQSHHYRPLPHTRHPINASINTTPGSQTQ